MTNDDRVAVIINAGAGGAQLTDQVTQELHEAFSTAGMNVQLMQAHNGTEIRNLTEKAMRRNPALVVAGGGDGTLNAVASLLAGTKTALGILPLGTLNHFAKDLRIPLDIGDACRLIAKGHTVAVDVGEVNGRIFVNNSSIGLYPHIVHRRDRQQHRLSRGKWHAMFWATLAVLRRSPFLDVRVCLDDVRTERRVPFVFIGNNEYEMEGFSIGMRKRLDCGRLSLYMTHRHGRWALLALALRALTGRLRQTADFDAVSAHTIRIETRRKRLLVATDGEVTVMQSPLDYRSRPGALRVITAEPEANKQAPA